MRILDQLLRKMAFLILLFPTGLLAQNPGQGGSPKDLQEGAEVVVERYNLEIDVHHPGKITAHHQIRYRVNSPAGQTMIQFSTITDKYRKLNQLELKAYAQSGKLLETLGKNEMRNQSYASDGTMVDDSRVLYLPEFKADAFPYVQTLDYSMEYKSAFFIPDFLPVFNYGVALKRGVLTVRDRQEAGTRYRIHNHLQAQAKTLEPGTFQIEFRDIAALQEQALSPPFRQVFPRVELVPGEFQMDQTEGSFKSWAAFGDWVEELRKAKGSLSEETKAEIQALVVGVDSPMEKAALLYHYLQENTRYVGIQLGIGGYKPFPAEKVDQLGYGDCKALSNYMVTLLEEVGVEAHYVLIYSGRNNRLTQADFPASNFNHVVVCLPMEQDTAWMECTSQVLPFNYLGASTADRYALLVKENGSQLVRTPQAEASGTVQETRYSVQVQDDGALEVDLVRNHTGDFLSRFSYLAAASEDVRDKWLRKQFGKSSTTFSDLSLEMADQIGQLKFHMIEPKAVRTTGKYLFLPRNLESEVPGIEPIKDPAERTLPCFIRSSQTFRYQWDLILPADYQNARLPKDLNIENQFGSLRRSAKATEGHLFAEVELVLNQGTYPAAAASEYNELASSWKKTLTSKWVLTQEE